MSSVSSYKILKNQETVEQMPETATMPTSNAKYGSKYMNKFKTRDGAKTNSFVYSNYADGNRGGRASDLDNFFENGSPLEQTNGFTQNMDNPNMLHTCQASKRR